MKLLIMAAVLTLALCVPALLIAAGVYAFDRWQIQIQIVSEDELDRKGRTDA